MAGVVVLPAIDGRWRGWSEEGADGTKAWRRRGKEDARGRVVREEEGAT